ncbi:hypothetical protein ACNJD7_21150, partial [Mycobacterium tuberculosis]
VECRQMANCGMCRRLVGDHVEDCVGMRRQDVAKERLDHEPPALAPVPQAYEADCGMIELGMRHEPFGFDDVADDMLRGECLLRIGTDCDAA